MGAVTQTSRASLRAGRLRALNVPTPVEVALDERGLPTVIRERSDSATSPAGWGGRRVAAMLEEWRVDDEWWRKPVTRRYVEVVLERGSHVVLFEDLNSGQWFLQRP